MYNAYIGKDPEGTFFYNSVTPLVPSTTDNTTHYRISRIINPSDNKPCSWIQFYHESVSKCYAEFLAYDLDETVQGSGLDGWSSIGDWKPLQLGSATAEVLKYDDSSKMTITCPSVSAKATIQDASNYLDGVEVKVGGNLFFKKLSDLADGKFASWNNDRIVFYKDDWVGTDFVGYFIPYEGLPSSLGISANNTKIFEKVSWGSS